MEKLLQSLLNNEKCASSLSNFNFEADCLKLLLSKLLGTLVILGSVLYKVPQIITICKKSSVEGLSALMFILEIYGQVITLGYNIRGGNPFSTYGEYVFMIVQNVIILLLFFIYSKNNDFVFSLSSIVFPVFFYFTVFDTIYVTEQVMKTLFALTVPIFIFSRVPQIIKNFSQGGVGALSFTTTFMQVAGSAARLFTTLQEVDDKLILFTTILAVGLNGILMLQIIYYDMIVGKKKSDTVTTAPSASSEASTPKKRKSVKTE
ncbi:hypothetical protein C9374_008966 [Naegleria lovaniensis]|uniref:Mannose-P-dolichol utilization defect 1 protein homolog n=1 Tax=Naegleria lovaniensis TaxID=51637 RepID=A0AA88GIL4_NAELO|nr:uncharacterized protein C9374_008966 [Naegleria lovaniensis]KAG2377881.1 hypothetical protein C9374_008966 [Naegleria lovaniensis]